ncbi:hypothetical protein ACFQ0X_31085 [Streptomyces rectiviolaceus]|uniref:Secreted protein n=1 Tax=Streptomyces rectiviolaceus TaxID=332591 RepID=A0ABP6M7V9_9ACTN
MSSSTTSLLIAVLGIFGTLVSGLLAQRTAERGRAADLAHAERQRIDDREYQAIANTREALRACYVALNTAALEYHSELNHFRYALEAGEVTDEMRSRLEDARREQRAQNAQAQMIVPDSVLPAANKVTIRLNVVYGIVKRIDGGFPPARPGESVDEARARIKEIWSYLDTMRSLMRESVGATTDPLTTAGAAER